MHRRRNDGRRLRYSPGAWRAVARLPGKERGVQRRKSKEVPGESRQWKTDSQPCSGVPKMREAGGRGAKLWLWWYEAFRRPGGNKRRLAAACDSAGLQAWRQRRRTRVRKGAERSCGKAVGVARRGEAGQGNVPRARPVESRTGALGEWVERHWLGWRGEACVLFTEWAAGR